MHFKKTKIKQKLAFTLVEVLMVVVSIWVLTTSLVPKVMQAVWRTRDTTRKYDVTQISQALNLLYMDKWQYPVHTPNMAAGWREISTDPGFLQALKGKYLASIPKDPFNIYTNIYPWTELQRGSDYLYVYAAFSSWYVWDPLYTCNIKDYAIIAATNFETTPPWMWPTCPGYDRSTLVDYGYVVSAWNVYAEYRSTIVGTGGNTTWYTDTNTWTWTNTNTGSNTNTWSNTNTGSNTNTWTWTNTNTWSNTNTWTNQGWGDDDDDEDEDENNGWNNNRVGTCPNNAWSLSIGTKYGCVCWSEEEEKKYKDKDEETYKDDEYGYEEDIRWTNEYTHNSNICLAARHAWMIKKDGGPIVLLITPWRKNYIGSKQNGIESKNKKNAPRGYRFYK